MESLTYLKNLKISPKKLRMIRDDIYRMSPQEALDYLMYDNSKAGKIYYKSVHSAIHNAINTLKVQADMLQFKLLTIEEGRTLKRFRAGSRGMAKPIQKEYSHIKIILVEDQGAKAKSQNKKKAEKKDTKKNEKKSSKAKTGIKKAEKDTKSKKATKKDTKKKQPKKTKKSATAKAKADNAKK